MEALTLHSLHQAGNGRFVELKGREAVGGYADVGSEYQALTRGVGLFDASFREWVALSGPDRVSFLHGLVTSHVNGLPEGQTQWTSLLTVKGAMVSDGRIWKRPDELWLEVEPGYGAAVKAFLEKYLISEDAELRDATAERALFSLIGPNAPVALSRFGSGDAVVAQHELLGVPQVDISVPRQLAEVTWAALRQLEGVTPVGFDALETVRVEGGIPRFGMDMEETTIPLEAHLQRAISYDKGCYIGQEVIARATFRGQVNKKLKGLLLANALPPRRTELFRGEKRAGFITSALHSPKLGRNIALGYVYRDSATPGTLLRLEGVDVEVCDLPFASR